MIKRVQNTSLKRRFVLVILIYLIITAALSGYALQVNRNQNDSLEWASQMFVGYESITTAQTELSNARRGARTYLLYNDPSGISIYQEARAAYEQALTNADGLVRSLTAGDSPILGQLQTLNANISNWMSQDVEPSIALRENWTGDAAALQQATLEWAQSPELQALFTTVSNDFSALIQLVRDDLVSHVEDVGTQNTSLTRILIGTLVLMTSFAILGSLFLYGEIARPLERLSKAARGIAIGDFTSRSGITSGNEIGIAAQAFDAMATQLQRLVADLEAAQHELAERELRLRSILENVGDAILIVAPDGEITEVNRAATELFASEDRLIGHAIAEIIPGTQEEVGLAGNGRAIAAAPSRRVEALKPDGTSAFLEINASSAFLEDRWNTLLCVRDATYRVQIEQKIEEQFRAAERSRQLTRSVLDAANDIMIYVDLDDCLTMVNRRHLERFGVGEADLTGRSVDEAAHEWERIFVDTVPLVEALHAPFSDEYPVHLASLKQQWPVEREYGLVVLPVTEETGEIGGRLAVLRDVSAERAADRMKSDFVALVSHELRTPLTSIKGYVELLLEEEFGAVSEEQKEILGIVSDSSLRLVTLTNDLLDISRIEAGRLDLHPQSVNLPERIRRVSDTLRAQVEAKQQVLTIDVPGDLPEVVADPNRIAQVLTNLVSNANKYTPSGGTIAIRARNAGDQVRVEVQDTGVGLTEDEQARLFSRFYRVQNRLTQSESGTGLGLAISKSLIEAQGGAIGLTSRPGQGSTFFFTLPISDGVSSTPDRVSGEHPGAVHLPRAEAGAARRILVVEDEREIAALIELYLRRAGYQTRATGTVQDAVEIATSWQPDLITLDVILDDGDGFEVLEALRADPRTSAIPVIFVSILPVNERDQALGAIDHLSKPINERSLIDRIGGVLGTDRKQTILIVDDDTAIRGYLRERLTRLGYVILEAANGEEALAVLAAQPVALALIDVKMPVLNGVETLQAMRAHPATAQVPVIMMTASPSAGDDHAATIERLGATLLNGKDLSAADLANVISAELLPAEPVIERFEADEPPATGPIALIADDDVNINRLLERRLRRQGMRVLTAHNGRAALDLIEQQPVDILFLDVAMPVLDGFGVLEAVRSRGLDIVVIMSTAFGSEAMAEEAMRRGADDFIAKPYEPEALSAVLDRTRTRLEQGARRDNSMPVS